MKFVAPIPPSNNCYYRRYQGKTLISREGHAYHKAIAKIAPVGVFGAVSLTVAMDVYPRDNRLRDLDNYPKALFDALTKAGFWKDDKYIDALSIKRMPVDKGNPRIEMEITEA